MMNPVRNPKLMKNIITKEVGLTNTSQASACDKGVLFLTG